MPSKSAAKKSEPKATKSAAAPAPAKKETKSKAKKEEVKKVAEPEVQNVEVKADSTETSITDNFAEFITKFQGMMSQFSSLKAELKVLERKTMKQLKVVQKLNNKKRKKGTRAPSGFVKPSLISDELAAFLDKPKGTEMARTDVTREINKYIRAHSLQDKENGRKINPDKSLQKLLKVEPDVNLTYFNLQRYMGVHFPKQTKAPVAASASA
tara:strand:- start:5226 stop:5858 length:633 start_codon:yes stop_codon:yes gene_type:complete